MRPAGASPPSQPESLSSSSLDQVLKPFNRELQLNCNQLGVGKAGLPPLFLSVKATLLSSQSSINSRQPFRQREHVVDDRVANLTIEVAQLRLRLAINSNAKRRDALVLCLPQSLARVIARVTRIAVIMIVRTPIRQDDEQARTGLVLFWKLMPPMRRFTSSEYSSSKSFTT